MPYSKLAMPLYITAVCEHLRLEYIYFLNCKSLTTFNPDFFGCYIRNMHLKCPQISNLDFYLDCIKLSLDLSLFYSRNREKKKIYTP